MGHKSSMFQYVSNGTPAQYVDSKLIEVEAKSTLPVAATNHEER
jgi:hypothetical protein